MMRIEDEQVGDDVGVHENNDNDCIITINFVLLQSSLTTTTTTTHAIRITFLLKTSTFPLKFYSLFHSKCQINNINITGSTELLKYFQKLRNLSMKS